MTVAPLDPRSMDTLTKELMQPTDELLWKQQGLFDHVDSLEKRFLSLLPKTFLPSPQNLFKYNKTFH